MKDIETFLKDIRTVLSTTFSNDSFSAIGSVDDDYESDSDTDDTKAVTLPMDLPDEIILSSALFLESSPNPDRLHFLLAFNACHLFKSDSYSNFLLLDCHRVNSSVKRYRSEMLFEEKGFTCKEKHTGSFGFKSWLVHAGKMPGEAKKKGLVV